MPREARALRLRGGGRLGAFGVLGSPVISEPKGMKGKPGGRPGFWGWFRDLGC